jgi:hypothetical protein
LHWHHVRSDRNRTARPRRRNAGLTLESLEVRLALSSVPAAPVPADFNPQPLPPGFVAEFRALTPDATSVAMRKAGGGSDLVFSPDPIYMNYNTVEHFAPTPDLQKVREAANDFAVTPDIVGQHIGTGVTPSIVGQHIGTNVSFAPIKK